MNSIRSIDLNADLGEHDGSGASADAAMLGVVSSANIACGAHAGTPDVMRATVAAALERGVSIGAHPSYPDRHGFGRRELGLTIPEILSSVRSQLANIQQCCVDGGANLSYVKPHGAMYNRASRDDALAHALAECVRDIDPSLAMLAMSGSALERASRDAGLAVAREAFIDRGYEPDGALVERGREGAVIDDPEIAARRALEIAEDGKVRSIDGKHLSIVADSLCVHGDNPRARSVIEAARQKLEAAGFIIAPFVR